MTAALTGATLIAFNERGGETLVQPQREPAVPATATADPTWLSQPPPPSPDAGPKTTKAETAVPSPGSRPPSPPRSSPSSPAHSSAPSSAPSGGQAPLSAAGTLDPHSNDYWAQDDLALRVRGELRALTVTIRVARTARVRPTGAWLSLPNADFQSSIETTRDAFVYRWVLLPGRAVQPGSYTLAAQYDRTTAHDPGGDTFTVQASALAGRSMTTGGRF